MYTYDIRRLWCLSRERDIASGQKSGHDSRDEAAVPGRRGQGPGEPVGALVSAADFRLEERSPVFDADLRMALDSPGGPVPEPEGLDGTSRSRGQDPEKVRPRRDLVEMEEEDEGRPGRPENLRRLADLDGEPADLGLRRPADAFRPSRRQRQELVAVTAPENGKAELQVLPD